MAEFRTFDLGRVLQTSEAIKGMRRQAETDKLRDAYMGVQMQNAQQQGVIEANQEVRAQEAHGGEQRVKEAKRVYHVSSAIMGSDDPIGAFRELAPEFSG
jgi:hypothetical protein